MAMVRNEPNRVWSASYHGFLVFLILALIASSHGLAASGDPNSPNPAAYTVGPLLYVDDFADLDHWKPELEKAGTVAVRDHILTLDVPKGCSLWLKSDFAGPLLIQYEARLVKADPPARNDRVSDLNCFWMATDPRNPADFFAVPQRTGKFSTYDQLQTYYVGQGGNTNSTTRFRRYIGQQSNRPLLPEHDLTAKQFLLTPNTWQTLQLIACNNLIEYYRDGNRIFSYNDPAPYTHGYFGFRTTFSHLELRKLQIYRLVALPGATAPK
jgi:Domain of unknown function (DUF6250)